MDREIAIVVGKFLTMQDEADIIASSITDWYTATEEEYATLHTYINSLNKSKSPYSYYNGEDHYHIITRIPTSEVPTLISECLKKATEYEEEKKKLALKREQKKKERETNKLKKQQEKEKQLLNELKKKYEV